MIMKWDFLLIRFAIGALVWVVILGGIRYIDDMTKKISSLGRQVY